MKIKNLLNEDVAGVLGEESMKAIQQAFDDKVTLAEEAALAKQDAEYAKKLQHLLNTIDENHTNKMKQVVVALDKDRTQKLMQVAKKYERVLHEDASQYKKQVVGAVSAYLDAFLQESVTESDLQSAVKNTTAMNVLSNLRKVLAVDSLMMKESVQAAVLDGKQKMTTLEEENTKLKRQYQLLEKNFNNIRINALIEEKISNMSDDKKNFIRKTLKDKTYDFVTENFSYVSKLFDKKTKEQVRNITEDAKKKSSNLDFIQESAEINNQTLNKVDATDPYVQELNRTFGAR